MISNSTFFIGIDLGDKHSFVTILDQEGELVEETRLPTSRTAFQRKFSSIPAGRIAMEVGTHSRWVSHLLKDQGHDVLVANTRKLRAIYHNPRKDDRTDAETLARLTRLDPNLLSPIHHRSPQAQADLAIIRLRHSLVRSRTLLINHVRCIVKSSGARLPSCSADCFVQKVSPDIPESLRPALMPILDTIATLTQQIHSYDRQIQELCKERYLETLLLQHISGAGPLTSLAFILTLENPNRFHKSREVGPALGLVPQSDQSGEHNPQLRITKTGNAFLRQLLVGSAQYILGPFGPDCDLHRRGLQLADRGGKNAKKRAMLAVARKLATLLHYLWKTGEVYDPFYLSRHSAEVPDDVTVAA
jgi:transposase